MTLTLGVSLVLWTTNIHAMRYNHVILIILNMPTLLGNMAWTRDYSTFGVVHYKPLCFGYRQFQVDLAYPCRRYGMDNKL